MFRWIPYAFVRIILFFCAGIVLAIYQPAFFRASTALLFFILSGLLFFTLTFVRHKVNFNPGIVGLATIFFGGYLNTQLHTDSHRVDHIINLKLPIEYYQAVITKPAVEKERSWKFEATVEAVKTKTNWQAAEGKILLYTDKKEFTTPLQYGDVLLIKGAPRRILPPTNPGEFDYRQFLAFRNIFHQHYARAVDVNVLGNAPPNVIIHYATIARSWAMSVLEKYIQGERERGLASALILGVRDGLDHAILDAYAATGSMHILAVSGLHVGIIYWMILMFTKSLRKNNTLKWTVAAISIFILWSYALITGLSPSVLRAVTMFSFFAIARPWNQRTNIYNILAVSAFCILLYDPYQIMSVGFQLSYLAVLGIVTLQPGIYRLWEPRYLFWDQVWKISAVAIAAQLATFSLGLLYFSQFPNYFLLSNLFVIPGAFVVLGLGLFTLAVSFIAPVAEVVGWILKWIISALNSIIFGIEKLPFSHLEDVYIDSFQCSVVIGLIVMIFLFIESKKFSYLIATFMLCMVLSISLWLHFVADVAIPTMTIYNVPGHTAIDFTQYGKAHFLADAELINNPSKADYYFLPNRRLRGARQILPCDSFHKQFEGCALMVWGSKAILQIQEETYWLPDDLEVDYVVISNNAVGSLNAVIDKVHAKQIILDSSNTFYHTQKILLESKKLNVAIYSVLQEGAFTLTI